MLSKARKVLVPPDTHVQKVLTHVEARSLSDLLLAGYAVV